jgi:hypothetical protein
MGQATHRLERKVEDCHKAEILHNGELEAGPPTSVLAYENEKDWDCSAQVDPPL